jgi:MFS family permease
MDGRQVSFDFLFLHLSSHSNIFSSLWLQGVALTLPSMAEEFGVDSNQIRYTTLALFLGLCIGASFWGVMSDVVGRRLAFNCTLGVAGVFGIAAGAAPNWIGACALYACVGLGVGGNLPVDGALLLEFLPNANGSLLTLLSGWWPIGQLIASLVAWPCIVHFPTNEGWRYFIYIIGALTFAMFAARFFLFHLFESPKFLLSRGRQAEAVAVVHGIAYHNGQKTWLTEDILNQIGGDQEVAPVSLSTSEIIKRNLSKFSGERIRPLFNGRQLAATTVLLWFIWTFIGMGYPLFNAFLPQYLGGANTPVNIQYRNYAITSAVGVPGSLLAWITVDIKYIGRKGTMAVATVISGVFLYVFTISADPNFQLTFSSLEAFFQNIMYGVLYAYTPEVFPAPNRGTGTGISSFLNRVAGLCAPIVAVNAGSANPASPIYASGALFFAAFLCMLALPIETRGRQKL